VYHLPVWWFLFQNNRDCALPSVVSGPEVLRTVNFSLCFQFHNSNFYWHGCCWYQWCIVVRKHTYPTAACCQYFLLPKKSIMHHYSILLHVTLHTVQGNYVMRLILQAVALNICCNQFQAGWLVISHNLTLRNRRLQKITFHWAIPLGISSFIHMCKCSCFLCYSFPCINW
jgi:hypothetical protein